MALDFMAIASNGAFPTPTPTTTQRAIYAVSWGLLGVAPSEGGANTFALVYRGMRKIISWFA